MNRKLGTAFGKITLAMKADQRGKRMEAGMLVQESGVRKMRLPI